MKKHKFQKVYKDSGKTCCPYLRGKSGCYIIKENGKIVYIGYSKTILYKTIFRHFQQWADPRAPRVTYVNKMRRNAYTLRVILCTKGLAPRLEKMLIIRHQPRDNKEKYKSFQAGPPEKRAISVYDQIGVIEKAPF